MPLISFKPESPIPGQGAPEFHPPPSEGTKKVVEVAVPVILIGSLLAFVAWAEKGQPKRGPDDQRYYE